MKENTYNQQTANFIASIIQNMPDVPTDVMQGWIENPKDLKRVLRDALCPPQFQFKVWKTVKLGTSFWSGGNFINALETKPYCLGDWGGAILRSSSMSRSCEEKQLDLVMVRPKMLGFKSSVSCQDLNWEAQQRGLENCPNEVGPQLRLQYWDQPLDEWLYVGMMPVSLSAGGPAVFKLGNNGHGLWLDGKDAFRQYKSDDCVVYVMPRK